MSSRGWRLFVIVLALSGSFITIYITGFMSKTPRPDIYRYPPIYKTTFWHRSDSNVPAVNGTGVIYLPLPTRRDRNFTILDWCPAYFSKENGLPETVMIDNCLIIRDKKQLLKSDAVLIEVRNIAHLKEMPQERLPWQRWVYLNVESPWYAMLDYVGRYSIPDFTGKLAFNWTMTYRTDADVPLLYGWKTKKSDIEKRETKLPRNIVSSKTKLVSSMYSNCHYIKNGRDKYIKELQKHISVDVYGKCGTLKCDGHLKNGKKGCDKIKDYKFYLSFENGNCRDYVTEKLWMTAFGNEAVPVVLGAYKEDYLKQAPPYSFIHTDDFSSPKELADYLNYLNKNDTAYSEYHKWRLNYKIDFEFRFIGDLAWRVLCATLNEKFDEKNKWYKNVEDFTSPEKDCYQNKWIAENS